MTEPCPWCGATGESLWEEDALAVREMMFGTRDPFMLKRCGICASLVLQDPPADLAPYYPPNYYSFESEPLQPSGPVRIAFGAAGVPLTRLGPGLADGLLARSRPSLGVFRALAGRGVRRSSRILDVGSGDGFQLSVLAAFGFRNLLGIDPYLSEPRAFGAVELRRSSLAEMKGEFDVIFFNHVLEHLADPAAELGRTLDRLAPGGTVVVRVPLSDSWAARTYGADWVQLDSPRHLTVPTAAGVKAAAGFAGLDLVREFRDSTGFGYWASEQYGEDVPLRDERSWLESPERSPLTAADIDRCDELAREHNEAGDGDQGCFVLERAGVTGLSSAA